MRKSYKLFKLMVSLLFVFSINSVYSQSIGGSITTSDSLSICVGDGVADPINVTLSTDTVGDSTQWVITDEMGLILGLPVSGPFDLEGAGAGVRLIWHLSYNTGLIGLTAGQNVSGLSGNYDFSDSLRVVRNPTLRDTTVEIICFNQSIIFHGGVYNATGFYSDTITLPGASCPSIRVLDLLIKDIVVRDTLTDSICFGETYTLGSQTFTTSGNYIDTAKYKTGSGCDSIIQVLTLFVFDQVVIDSTRRTICEGDSVQLGSTYYKATGNYSDTLRYITGCDSSISVLILTIAPTAVRDTVKDTICEGSSKTFRGTSHTVTGFYSDTLVSVLGCDSAIHNLDLLVRGVKRDTTRTTVCFGDSTSFEGTYYKVAGLYSDSTQYTSGLGCDSIIKVLDLTINNKVVIDTTRRTICAGDSALLGSTYYKATGDYSDTLRYITGCDSSISVLILTIAPTAIRDTVKDTICEGSSKMFRGTSYTATGMYSDTLASALGCDSAIHNFDLLVRGVIRDTTRTTVCFGDSTSFEGTYYKVAGFYSDSTQYTSGLGCDSIIKVLDLTINNNVVSDTTRRTICAGDSVLLGSSYYKTTGNYSDTLRYTSGCDSSISVLKLIVAPTAVRDTRKDTICEGSSIMFRGTSYTATGFYSDTLASALGCDSAIHNFDLLVRGFTRDTTRTTVCFGDSTSFEGTYYKVAGFYSDTIQYNSGLGCDSIIKVLDLTINNKVVSDTTSQSICFGDSSLLGSIYYKTTGEYSDTLRYTSGCDSSISVLKLSVSPAAVSDIIVIDTICEGSFKVSGGSTYTTTGIYIDTLKTVLGCDSAIHTLDLFVLSVRRDTIDLELCVGQSVIFHGVTYVATGAYSDTIKYSQGSQGCDSVIEVLNLRVTDFSIRNTIYDTICFGTTTLFAGQTLSVAGVYIDTVNYSVTGCDSLITTYNLFIESEVLRDTMPTATICFGDSILFEGVYYNSTGFYSDTTRYNSGCDSLIKSIDLIVTPRIVGDTVRRTICANESTLFGGLTLTIQGVYNDTVKTVAGCDSISILSLTVNPIFRDTTRVTICANSSVMHGGISYNTAGFYSDTLQTVFGCDSIFVLDLSVNPFYIVPVTVTVCDKYTTVTGRVINYSGSFMDTLTSVLGCDSIIVTALTVNYSTLYTLNVSACGSYTSPSGKVWLSSGTRLDTIPNASGCDSLMTINLIINSVSSETRTITSCFSYTVPETGSVYTASGTYRDLTTNAFGCAHTITTILTINTAFAGTITASGITLTSSATGVSYKWVDCDNNYSYLLEDTNQTYTPPRNGNYACWITTPEGCSDTTNCIAINSVSLEENKISASDINVYPNPANDFVTIDILNQNRDEAVMVRLFDSRGKMVYSETISNTNNKVTFDVSNLAEGMYSVMISNEYFSTTKKVIVVK